MAVATRSSNKTGPSNSAMTTFTHAPSGLSLFWLAVSLPLVAWDCGYVLMRPRTMPGGDLHWPLWVPYKLYGEVDHVYGWKSFNARNGFTSAQGLLNVIETLMYAYYAWSWYSNGRHVAGKGKVLVGKQAGTAMLVAFTAAAMTLSKTVLYWLCEYYSGFDNIGHNAPLDLIFLWIIPNGAWLVFPIFMLAELGSELVNGLDAGANLKEE
ncbi:hypothetical protein GGR57DRAFT_138831 [Xylariaceae sp. FL1272]|nr:hypothetical protein GGR57DRAFT_138831 [Xylariaceae sp. FL1272]